MADQIVDIISKLGIDASEVYSEIDKVNIKYAQSSEALRKQKKELDDLIKYEAGLQAQRAKTNNPSVVAQFNKEIEKTKVDIDKTNKALAESQVQIKGTTKAGTDMSKDLSKAFEGTSAKVQESRAEITLLKQQIAEVEGVQKSLIKTIDETSPGAEWAEYKKQLAEVNGDLGRLKDELITLEDEHDILNEKPATLRSELAKLKDQIARTSDPAELHRLTEEAGEIQSKITEANEAVKAFGTESKTKTAQTLFGQIAHDIASLDFEGAAIKAKQFSQVMRTISVKEVLGGIKNLGSALLNLGKTLLTPPLGVIIAIAAAVYAIYQMVQAQAELEKQSETLTETLKEQGDAVRTYASRYFEANIKIKEIIGNISEKEAEILRQRRKAQDDFLALGKEFQEKVIALAEDIGVDLAELGTDGFFGDSSILDTDRLKKEKFDKELLKLQELFGKRYEELTKAQKE